MIDRFMEVDQVVEALKQGEDPEEYIHHQQELEEQQAYGATQHPGRRNSSSSSSNHRFIPSHNNNNNNINNNNTTIPAILEDEEATVNQPLIERPKNPGAYKKKKDGTSQWVIQLAINLSFVANFILFGSKFLLAIYAGSMAILASAFESFLDLLSNAIIFFTIRIMKKQDYYKYPVGKVSKSSYFFLLLSAIIQY